MMEVTPTGAEVADVVQAMVIVVSLFLKLKSSFRTRVFFIPLFVLFYVINKQAENDDLCGVVCANNKMYVVVLSCLCYLTGVGYGRGRARGGGRGYRGRYGGVDGYVSDDGN